MLRSSKFARDKVNLAEEYLELVKAHPATVRTVVFHTRRMLKKELEKFQLMQECISCESVEEVEAIVTRVRAYRENPEQVSSSESRRDELRRRLFHSHCYQL